MFKVSEVAEMLSVEKVKIFEALLVHDELLAPFITKERHLTYISEVGVRKLEQLLFNNLEEETDFEPELETFNDTGYEDDHLDKFIKKTEEKKLVLRNEIVDIKRQLNLLDKEMRIKDEAILNFQTLIKDDLNWLNRLELKVDEIKDSEISEDRKSGFFNRMKK